MWLGLLRVGGVFNTAFFWAWLRGVGNPAHIKTPHQVHPVHPVHDVQQNQIAAKPRRPNYPPASGKPSARPTASKASLPSHHRLLNLPP